MKNTAPVLQFVAKFSLVGFLGNFTDSEPIKGCIYRRMAATNEERDLPRRETNDNAFTTTGKQREPTDIHEELLDVVPNDLKALVRVYGEKYRGMFGRPWPTAQIKKLADGEVCESLRQNLLHVIEAGGSVDDWIDSDLRRNEKYKGKKGKVFHLPALHHLQTAASLQSYLDVLDARREKNRLGPILSVVGKEGNFSETFESDPDDDLRFIIDLSVVHGYVNEALWAEAYLDRLSCLGLGDLKSLHLSDEVFCYVGLKLRVHCGSMPSWFIEAVERFSAELPDSIFRSDFPVHLFNFLYAVENGFCQKGACWVGAVERLADTRVRQSCLRLHHFSVTGNQALSLVSRNFLPFPPISFFPLRSSDLTRFSSFFHFL